MPERIPQSATIRVPLKAYLASDHVTPATGKTLVITISKNGGAYANPSAGATNAVEIASGSYYVDLSTTDTGTLGPLFILGTASGVDPVEVIYDVVVTLTAAAIATGVWQDATAGDFTTAGSIGKSLFTSGAVPGAAGGLFIAGTNAATTVTTAFTTTFTGNLTGSVASVTARVTANTDQLAGQAVTAAAGVTFPTSVASPTNITAGTLTTVTTATNLTNAPTAGDLTAVMKASVTTAATSATPVAASVTGAVGSVTGNVGGNVVGTVASVVGAVGSVTAAVTLDKTQALSAARDVSAVADTSLTLNDALHCAIAATAGRETIVSTAYTVMTAAGTVLRIFALDSSTAPTSRQ